MRKSSAAFPPALRTLSVALLMCRPAAHATSSGGLAFEVRAVTFSGPTLTLLAPPPPPLTSDAPCASPHEKPSTRISPLCFASELPPAIPSMRRK